MIAIIDYGMGNLRSVQKGFEMVGHKAVVASSPEEVSKASSIVLPGVGAFRDCMKNLKRSGLIDTIKQGITHGKPFLGICLGLQLLFTESEEFGIQKGLDIVKGRVKRLPCGQSGLKVPHMGWNTVEIKRESPIMKGIPDKSYFYFVHSYYVEPSDRYITDTATDYGICFVSSISIDNLFAVQFHPEKSQKLGLRILKNFGNIKKVIHARG